MREFVIEAYQPASSTGELDEQARRLLDGAAQVSRKASPVRFARLLYLPLDEVCFCLYEAESAEVAGEAALRAGLRYERITEALELSPEPVSK